jgi:hypothetical protein
MFLGPDMLASTRAWANQSWKAAKKVEETTLSGFLPRTEARSTPADDKLKTHARTHTKKAAPALSTTYFAKELIGYLGQHPKDPTNLPADDIFEVLVEQEPADYAYAYLQYRVKGPHAAQALGKSVNGNAAYISADAGEAYAWKEVAVAVDKRELFKGTNTVRFALDYAHKSPLEVKDVQLSLTQQPLQTALYEATSGMLKADAEVFTIVEGEGQHAYALDARNLPAIPNHITNVSKGGSGYSVRGPLGKQVRISIAVDQKKMRGNSMQEVMLFFFDAARRRWVELTPEHVDMTKGMVEGEAPGNSQYFAGMIKSPEMPEASAYMPTAISDLEAANPSAGMTIIQPPSISQTGEASVSYPLSLPQGRNGMTPQLSLDYSSDAKEGWLGMGWSIPIPQISIDSRWGVPDLTDDEQMESYVLNGKPLNIEGGLRPNRGTIKSDKLDPILREDLDADEDEKVRFFEPTMSSYKEIIRHGSDPADYFWTVREGDGTTYFYGTIDEDVVEESAVLSSGDGILRWYLTRVEDKWGNTINYTYSSVTETSTTNPLHINGQYVQLLKIEYTGYGTNKGDYAVEFSTSKERLDARLNLSLGVKELDFLTLDSILVKFQGNRIKTYKLNYETGDFFKMRLADVAEWRSGSKFYEHNFEYYNQNLTYSAPETYNVYHNDKNLYQGANGALMGMLAGISGVYSGSPVSTQTNVSVGVGGSVGVGVEVAFPDITGRNNKDLTFSGHLAGNWGKSLDNMSLTDVDGDGLPDVVFKEENGLYFYPFRRPYDAAPYLGGPKKIKGRSNLSVTKQSSYSYGFDFTMPEERFFYGQNWRRSKSNSRTFMTDYNSDGFIDLVETHEGKNLISFGIVDAFGELSFAPTSKQSYNPVIKHVEVTVQPETNSDVKDFEIVRVWVAPFAGTINISGSASMVHHAQGEAKILVQQNSTILGSPVTVNESTSPSITHSSVSVQAGDLFLFRVQADLDGQGDFFAWNPQVTYTSSSSSNYVDANGYNYQQSDYEDGFLLSSPDGVKLMSGDQVKVSWPALSLNGLTDDVTFKIRVVIADRSTSVVGSGNNREYSYTLPAQGSTSLSLSQLKDAGNNSASFLSTFGAISGAGTNDIVTMAFEVTSTSNVLWQNIDWRPKVEVSTANCGQAAKIMYPTVYFKTFNRMYSLCTPLDNSEVSSCDNFLLWPSLSLSSSDVLSAFDTESYYSNCGVDIRKISYFVVKSSSGDLLYKVALELQNDGTYDWYYVNADGSLDGGPMSEIPFDLEQECDWLSSGVVFYGFYSQDELVAQMLAANLSDIDVYDAGEEAVITSLSDYENFYHHVNEFQDQTLQWGQFAWSKSGTSNTMLVSELYSTAYDVATAPGNDYSGEEDAKDEDIEALAESLNPSAQKFFALAAVRGERNKELLRTYIVNSLSSPSFYKGLDRWSVMQSHMGAYSVSGQIAPGKMGEQEEFPQISERVEEPANKAYGASGIELRTKSYSKAITYGATVPAGVLNLTAALSKTIEDDALYNTKNITQFLDINGDGYPDVMDAESGLNVQLTHPSGGHRSGGYSSSAFLNSSAAYNLAPSISGHYINNMPGYGMLFEPTTPQISFGDNYTLGDWMDMNGDGLPDYVDHQSLEPLVRLNNGRTLHTSVSMTLPTGVTQVAKPGSENRAYSVGGNMGLNPPSSEQQDAIELADNFQSLSGLSFSIGVKVTGTGTKDEHRYIDLNGDGLVDRVQMTGSTPLIYINTGTAFKACANCGSTQLNNIGSTGNLDLIGSLAATYGLTLAEIGVIRIKMSLSGNTQFNHSIGRTLSAFKDMNGDGVPDFVETNKEGDLIVYYAQVNKSNLLKKVTNPLRGSFTVDYELVGSKFGMEPVQIETHKTSSDERMVWDMPYSKWVMSRLTIEDGYDVPNDGNDEVIYGFRYDGGIKSRRNREFLGFTRIQTLHPTPLSDWLTCAQNRVYTSEVKEFFRPLENSPQKMIEASFKKGLLHSSLLLQHDEVSANPETSCSFSYTISLLSKTKNDYEYRYVDVNPGSGGFNKVKETSPESWVEVVWSTVSETATIFPALIGTESVKIPVVEEPTKVHVIKNDIAYDAYFNVYTYSSGAFDGPASVSQVSVGTQTISTVDVISRQHQYSHFGTLAPFITPYYMYKRPSEAFLHNVVLIDSFINPQTQEKTLEYYTIEGTNTLYSSITIPRLEYYIVPSLQAGYADDTVFAPNWMEQLSCPYDILAESNAVFLSRHRKVSTSVVNIYEDQYNVTTYGDIIARMIYFPPSAATSYQTTLMDKHQVYLGSISSTNLKRKTVVSTIANSRAPGVIETHYAPGNVDLGAVTLTYDTYGNVLTLTGAENLHTDQLVTTFTYDNVVHQFVEGISNSYGDAVCNAYDYGTGLLKRTTDINGHPTQYVYDQYYRPLEI